LLARHPEQACSLDHKERAEALAGAEARIAHGVEQARRPGKLIADRRLAEQLVEQPFRVLRNLVEALLALRCRVHTVPARYSGRLSMRSAAISPAPNLPSRNTHLTWVSRPASQHGYRRAEEGWHCRPHWGFIEGRRSARGTKDQQPRCPAV